MFFVLSCVCYVCARLFICALWSPAGKGLTSWLSFVVSSVSLSLSHWYPGSGVVLDCIDSCSLHLYLLLPKVTFRTSVGSLHVEADEPSLYSRREKLSLQYAIRLAAYPSNPAHEVTFPPTNVDLYEQKPKAIKPFGIRISPLLESANIKPQNSEKHFTPNIPARCMKPPEILFDLHSGEKSESNPHILKDDLRKFQSRYKNYQQI